MLKLDRILGKASDSAMAERLHALDHAGRIEYVVLTGEDTRRHRLHVSTDRGTECAIMLPRSEHLENGAVLHLMAVPAPVHHHIGNTGLGDQPGHLRIGQAAADVIDQACARLERGLRHLGPHGVHTDRDAGRGERADDRSHPP